MFGEPVRVHDDEDADDDHRQLQPEIGEREQGDERWRPRPVTLRMLSTQPEAITAAATPIPSPALSKPPEIGSR